jgi:hypothetical protein
MQRERSSVARSAKHFAGNRKEAVQRHGADSTMLLKWPLGKHPNAPYFFYGSTDDFRATDWPRSAAKVRFRPGIGERAEVTNSVGK